MHCNKRVLTRHRARRRQTCDSLSQQPSMVSAMSQLRPWRDADPDLFRFTTTELRDLHIALMTAFDQSAILAPALNLDQVRAALRQVGWDDPVDDEVLTRALAALTGWGLLEATQDHGAFYSTPEEFERKNLQWSLTPRGEAGIGGLLHALESLRHAVGLQPAVLDAIGDGLLDLADMLAQPSTDALHARIHLRLAEVEGHHAALLASVRQFNGHLQRLLREEAADESVFADVKSKTVSYLKEYVDGVEGPQHRLAAAIERLADAGLSELFDRALRGANLAPVAGGDPAPSWLEKRGQRWRALRVWFAPVDGATPRIEGLLDIARSAIIELLRVLERRWDHKRRSASVANDFRRLAGWFAAAPGDAEAHQLFAAAFGLWPARHAHLLPVDGQQRAPTLGWAEADPVDVAPALRASGSLAVRGRPRRVDDPRQTRALRQRLQAESLAELDGIRASLTTAGRVPISSFADLPVRVFAELFELLATGLEAPRAQDGTRRALSIDGSFEVILWPPIGGGLSSLHTENGTFGCPDFGVSIAFASSAHASPLPAGGPTTVGETGADPAAAAGA
jgi:uncharacterized protein (TIGR02677 family)